jgi:hypothetical protein
MNISIVLCTRMHKVNALGIISIIKKGKGKRQELGKWLEVRACHKPLISQIDYVLVNTLANILIN